MTRMKHYHLGCGESLQSNRAELLILVKTANADQGKTRLNRLPKAKPEKRH